MGDEGRAGLGAATVIFQLTHKNEPCEPYSSLTNFLDMEFFISVIISL